MGLIREPLDVDFNMISKVWTDIEEKEFSELIRKQKNSRLIRKLNNYNTDHEKVYDLMVV